MGMALAGDAVIACAQDSGQVVRVSKGQTEVISSDLEAPCRGGRRRQVVRCFPSATLGLRQDVFRLDGGRSEEMVASGFLQPHGWYRRWRRSFLFVAEPRAQRTVLEGSTGVRSPWSPRTYQLRQLPRVTRANHARNPQGH